MTDSIKNIQTCAKTDIGFNRENNEDIFLLCSDGLYDILSDIETKEILMENPKVSDQCDCLVARVLDKGGKDNVTVIVIQV